MNALPRCSSRPYCLAGDRNVVVRAEHLLEQERTTIESTRGAASRRFSRSIARLMALLVKG